jgi:hypothetical protein
LLALLVLPGILVRAAVPTGFMPAVGDGATLTMKMCSGHAAQPVVVHLGGAPALPDPGQPSSQHHEAPCVFAATAGGAPPPLIAVVAVASTPQADHVSPSFVAPIMRPAARAHAPRAPPPLA